MFWNVVLLRSSTTEPAATSTTSTATAVIKCLAYLTACTCKTRTQTITATLATIPSQAAREKVTIKTTAAKAANTYHHAFCLRYHASSRLNTKTIYAPSGFAPRKVDMIRI